MARRHLLLAALAAAVLAQPAAGHWGTAAAVNVASDATHALFFGAVNASVRCSVAISAAGSPVIEEATLAMDKLAKAWGGAVRLVPAAQLCELAAAVPQGEDKRSAAADEPWRPASVPLVTQCASGALVQPAAVAVRAPAVDYSCLVQPPSPPPPTAAEWTGHDPHALARFVSDACNVHMGADGRPSAAGRLEARLVAAATTLQPPTPGALAAAAAGVAACGANHTAAGGRPQSAPCWYAAHRAVSAAAGGCPTLDVTGWNAQRFLREVLAAHRPVLLTGTDVRHWPALAKWGREHLAAVAGDRKLHVKLAPGGVFEGSEPAAWWGCDNGTCGVPPHIHSALAAGGRVVARPASAELPLRELFAAHDAVQARRQAGEPAASLPSQYVEYLSLARNLGGLWDDVPLAGGRGQLGRLLAGRSLAHGNVWLGDGHTVGKAHFDAWDNVLVPVRGSKEVFLWPPYNASWLAAGHLREAFLAPVPGPPPTGVRRPGGLATSTSLVNTPVDVAAPDFAAVPAFAAALPHARVCHVRPGQALFLPSFWWHEVLSHPAPDTPDTPHNSAVNFWYHPVLHRPFPCAHCEWRVDGAALAALA